MESRELFWIVKKHWKLILLLPLICAVIGAYMSDSFNTPMYQATAKILIKKGEASKQTEIVTKGETKRKEQIVSATGEKRDEESARLDETVRREEQKQQGFVMDDVNFGQQIAMTYTEIAKSREVTEKVKKQLNIAEHGDVQIQLTHIKGTQLLNLRIVGEDPDQVFEACDVFMKTFSQTIEKISGAANLEVIEAPQLPQHPMRTNKKQMAFGGFLLGLLLAMGSALVTENTRNTIKTEEDIQNKVGISVLGSVPNSASGKSGMKDGEQLVVIREPHSFATETFRGIRTIVNALPSEERTKTLLLTSVKPLEGTSTVASNLACVLASEGKKVLLVDCNLKKPSLHKVFGVDNKKGLVEMFAQGGGYGEYIQKTPQGPDLMLAGNNSDRKSDLWGTEAMRAVMGEIKGNYDYVLFDAPPVTLCSDALELSSHSNAVLLVVKQDSVSYELFEKGVYRLRQVSANIVGAVLNRATGADIVKKY
ncbi:MAG: polysaccharide biosynthesis tyrosine autokinase [Filifactor alocis]|nr:polysaccharide biosynthesis tyrosine autokinase [Filifactor alocis]